MLIDLDGFKQLNDRFGHLAGDDLLRDVAGALQHTIRAQDTAARIGGDEFCVLLSCDLAGSGAHVAAAIEALTAEGEGFSITSSHGIASLPLEAQTPTAALRLADTRMYA